MAVLTCAAISHAQVNVKIACGAAGGLYKSAPRLRVSQTLFSSGCVRQVSFTRLSASLSSKCYCLKSTVFLVVGWYKANRFMLKERTPPYLHLSEAQSVGWGCVEK